LNTIENYNIIRRPTLYLIFSSGRQLGYCDYKTIYIGI